MRGLICLSDEYRLKLYDLLGAAHPEAFDNHDTEACLRSSLVIQEFLREQLRKEKIEVNEDAFNMLCQSLFSSREFNVRVEEYRRKNR